MYKLTRQNSVGCPAGTLTAMLTVMTRALDRPKAPRAQSAASDPFPLKGIDHIQLYVGNAKQAAYYYSAAFGMTCVAYRGPEQGYRDHAEYVLTSGAARFVVTGGVHAGSAATKHYMRHGDGIADIALAVPDVDRAYA